MVILSVRQSSSYSSSFSWLICRWFWWRETIRYLTCGWNNGHDNLQGSLFLWSNQVDIESPSPATTRRRSLSLNQNFLLLLNGGREARHEREREKHNQKSLSLLHTISLLKSALTLLSLCSYSALALLLNCSCSTRYSVGGEDGCFLFRSITCQWVNHSELNQCFVFPLNNCTFHLSFN